MAFNGKYRKGYMRTLREQKREEAQQRQLAYLRKQIAEAKEPEQEH